MSVKNKAIVTGLNEYDENDVTLLINDFSIICFVNYCPYKISIGGTYEVELQMVLGDDYTIEETSPETPKAIIINGFSYYLSGKLTNSTFETFTLLADEDIHYEHPHLNDRFVKIEVARINASF